MGFFLQQDPIVFEVASPPPVTPEITYPQVILGAIGAAGIIMVIAALAGLLAGAVIIYVKKRHEAAAPSTDTGHVRLGI
jgi:hypothetical protein